MKQWPRAGSSRRLLLCVHHRTLRHFVAEADFQRRDLDAMAAARLGEMERLVGERDQLGLFGSHGLKFVRRRSPRR